MNARTLRDDDHALVDLDLPLFRLTWKGYVPGHMLRRILIQAVMQVQQHRVRYWLSDSCSLGAILREDELWNKDEMMPQLLRTGLERLAIVMSQDFFTRMSTDRLVDHSRSSAPFPVQMFDSAENAKLWLFTPKVAVALRNNIGPALTLVATFASQNRHAYYPRSHCRRTFPCGGTRPEEGHR